MTGRVTTALTLAGALAGLGLAASVLHARDARYPAAPPTERLLYLRSPGVAKRLMLSFDGLAADIYWIRAIQHYGRDANPMTAPEKGKFELLQPLLDLTTTLDPHFNIAYRFGAIFLSAPPGTDKGSGPGRVDQAIALLEKGLANNPDRWVYAQDAGFIHYTVTGDYIEASRWFERAAAMPGAPEWLSKLAANTRIHGGDRQGARAQLERLTKSEEKYIREMAERGLLQLDAMDQIDQLQSAVEEFHARNHAYPAGFQQLFGEFKKDPTGVTYDYDREKGRVTLSEKSSLHPLPKALLSVPKGLPGSAK
jgi:tetratricopeptide (TPR) repeat protein